MLKQGFDTLFDHPSSFLKTIVAHRCAAYVDKWDIGMFDIFKNMRSLSITRGKILQKVHDGSSSFPRSISLSTIYCLITQLTTQQPWFTRFPLQKRRIPQALPCRLCCPRDRFCSWVIEVVTPTKRATHLDAENGLWYNHLKIDFWDFLGKL